MKSGRSGKPDQKPLAGRSAGAAPVPAAAFSPGRKWLFRFLAVFLVPALVLSGLELLFRLLGFGFDSHFFKPATIGGKDGFVANHDFGLRFFPRSQVRIPDMDVMPAAKAPNTFRIFIFGESAALGDPRPNFGAGCYLEVLLAERFPEAKFEIINTSMTAINSHVILPIAQECTLHSGDLWLIYMGNNEMVGPFGAATVFGARAPPLWLVWAQLKLRSLRLGQLLLAATQRLHKSDTAGAGWHGMEMFVRNPVAPNDTHKETIYRNFEGNLNEILKAGKASGAKIILSTVAVNLKDCQPFGTISGADLPSSNRAAYEQLCNEGTAAEEQGDFTKAQSDFQQATEISSHSAEAQFQLATCLLRLTNMTSALPHFQQAVDDDTLPFRADSRINEIIRTAARRSAGETLALCDAAEALAATSPDGIPGEERFYEHVHLNPNGNYALALVWAGQAEKLLSPALKHGARSSWASQAECEGRLGLTDWNRVSILEDILRRIQRPPFSGQSGNARQLARLRDEIAQLRQHLTSDAAAQAQQVYSRALARAPENFRLHQNYAEFLEARQEWKPAIAERKKVCELLPYFYFPYYALGMDLKDAGALAEAREALLKAALLGPEQGDVRLELGIVCGRQSDWEPARRELEAARRLSPEDPRASLYLGEVLWKLERRAEAVAALREAIRLAPSDWQPHYRLASDLAQQGQFTEAATEYQEALRLNPDSVKVKLGLATVLLNLGRESEAVQQVDQALKLEPANQAALELRRKLRGM
jgi:tetratricopeptide (TPR) repeat protein